MHRIFLNYRRTDSEPFVDLLASRLEGALGKGSVFRDRDSIPLGDEWRQKIKREIQTCSAFLAVVGPGWRGQGSDGDDEDWVREEIELAHGQANERELLIAPIFVDLQSLPAEYEALAWAKPLFAAHGHWISTKPKQELPRRLDELVEKLHARFKLGTHDTIVLQPLPEMAIYGRSSDLEWLGRSIPRRGSEPVQIVLYGEAGVGKTRLALEYAHRHNRHDDSYRAVLMVVADSPRALNQGLVELATKALLDPTHSDELADASGRRPERVINWLWRQRDWLLILDNADSPDAIRATSALCRQKLWNGHIIITSRSSEWPSTMKMLKLELLSEDAATQFLLDRSEAGRALSERDDREEARKLSRELGCLPVALEQAGARLAGSSLGLTIARYRQLWRQHVAHMSGVAATLLMTLDYLPAGAQVRFELLCLLAPHRIPRSLLDPSSVDGVEDADLEESIRALGERFAPDARPSSASDELLPLSKLFSYSLLKLIDGSSGDFMIHSLVQEIMERRAEPRKRQLWPVLLQALAAYAERQGMSPTLDLLVHSERAVNALTRDPGLEAEVDRRLTQPRELRFLGFAFRWVGDAVRSAARYERLVKSLDPASLDGAKAALDFAAVLLDLGRPNRAKVTFEAALTSLRQLPQSAESAHWMADGHQRLAWCERYLGEFELALEHFTRAEECSRLARRDQTPDEYALGRGACLDSLGEYGEALRLYQRAEAREQEAKNEVECFTVAYFKGYLLIRTGLYAEGLRLCEDAAAAAERFRSLDQISEAHWIMSLGHLAQNDFAKADTAISQSLAHPNLLSDQWLRVIKGTVTLRLGDRSAAQSFFRECIERCETKLQEDGPAFCVLDALALAECGTFLCGDVLAAERARRAFVAARDLSRASGAIWEILLLFDCLNGDGRLNGLRSCAAGTLDADGADRAPSTLS